MTNIEIVLNNLEKTYEDMSDLYNHIILYVRENYDNLTSEELDYIDNYMRNHAHSIRTRMSIYKFVPRKQTDTDKREKYLKEIYYGKE